MRLRSTLRSCGATQIPALDAVGAGATQGASPCFALPLSAPGAIRVVCEGGEWPSLPPTDAANVPPDCGHTRDDRAETRRAVQEAPGEKAPLCQTRAQTSPLSRSWGPDKNVTGKRKRKEKLKDGSPAARVAHSPGGFSLQLFHLSLELLVGLRDSGCLPSVELQRLQETGGKGQ